jgi:hypothetical protein
MRRPLLLAAALAALAGAACSSPCQDLGDRLCSCAGAGSARDTCKRTIQNQLNSVNPSKATENTCECLLSTCREPAADVYFCEWITTDAGRQACGLAYPAGPDRSAPPAQCYACVAGEAPSCDGTTCWCCPEGEKATCAGGACTCAPPPAATP